jgi:hypothetical protein
VFQTKPGKGGKKENGKQKDLAIMETQVAILKINFKSTSKFR